MTIRQTFRCLSSLSLLGLVVFFMAGCVEREPPALTQLYSARDAITAAKQAGAADRFPDEYAQLEKRYLEARGVFYACQEARALELGQALLADANALATKRVAVPPPPPAAPMNRPPQAVIAAVPEGEVGTLLKFDASGSSDPDGDALAYKWDFGDGTTSNFTFPVATHRYQTPGNYLVRLMVDDSKGGTDTAAVTVPVVRHVTLQETEKEVYFDFDKATLKPAGQQALATVVQEMRDNPQLIAEIVGHTDSTGPAEYNMGLSKRRAEAVANFLKQQGIGEQRLRVAWKGETEPIAENTTKEGRAKNRRTEVTVRLLPMQ
jgi:outer membrane protein OmpA-like peptidoglycan-associated protein